jgi:DNA replication protein DnaC
MKRTTPFSAEENRNIESGALAVNEHGWTYYTDTPAGRKLKEKDKMAEGHPVRHILSDITLGDPKDYPKATYKCKKCRDMGWEEITGERFGRTYTSVKRCICLENRMQEAAVKALRDKYPIFEHNSFETYKPENKSQVQALKVCQAFVSQWPYHDGRGILLCGPVGTGKTCLLYLMMLGCMRKKRFGFRRVKTEKLLSRIRSTFDKGMGSFDDETEYTIIEEMSGIDVLLLDDLGIEKDSDFADRTMFNILDERYEKKRLTFATSNLYLVRCGNDKCRAKFALPVGDLDICCPKCKSSRVTVDIEDKLGQRLYSRRNELFTTIIVEGDDRRERK